MIFKIIRGAFVGVLLGILFGIAISGAMYMKIGMKNEIAQTKGKEAISISTSGMANNLETDELQQLDEAAVNQLCEKILEPAGITLNESLVEENISGYGIEDTEETAAVQVMESAAVGEEAYNDVHEILLRFHVKANSDSAEDIDLKYKVRDAVLAEFDCSLQEFNSKEEAIQFLNDNLEYIKEIADETIRENGYAYTTSVYVTNDYFPMRQYGELVIPAGYYEALRIDIGQALGENFWCVLYPMMCYPIDGGAVMSREDGKQLAKELDEEQYEKLFVDKEVRKEQIKVKFKFLEWLGFQ